MDELLTNFVRALCNAQVRVSTAETLDAMQAVRLVDYRDRALLKNTLDLVLPKSRDDKAAFDACFDKFFALGAAGNVGGDRSIPSDEPPAALEQAGVDRSVAPLEPQSSLGQLLASGDRTDIGMAIAAAGNATGVQNIEVFTQKSVYVRKIMNAMGLPQFSEELDRLQHMPSPEEQRLARELTRRRDWLRERVRDYVEHQFLLHADVTGKRLREELLRTIRLSNADQRSLKLMQEIVLRMAKRLASLYSRRRRIFRRGQLHVPRTLRANAGYDGAIVDLRWRSQKIDRPKVFIICDVSGSVAEYAKFILLLLYSLEEVLPKVRSFAFSSELGEVSPYFARHSLEDAIARILLGHGGGSTDYGRSLQQFTDVCLGDIDRRTTLIILGDARNNYGAARADVLKTLYERSKQLIWLNPESRVTWDLGDSEMKQYATYCHHVEECGTLSQLERVVSRLLRAATQGSGL